MKHICTVRNVCLSQSDMLGQIGAHVMTKTWILLSEYFQLKRARKIAWCSCEYVIVAMRLVLHHHRRFCWCHLDKNHWNFTHNWGWNKSIYIAIREHQFNEIQNLDVGIYGWSAFCNVGIYRISQRTLTKMKYFAW